MPPYGEPDWATPGNTNQMQTVDVNTSATPAGAVAPPSSSSSSGGRGGDTKLWITLLSLMNFGLAAAMAALGLLSLLEMDFKELNDLTEAFLAIYMVIFAVLLAIYEFIWWQPSAQLNKMFRKNFGFMYGLKGKGFYLIFIAFLCIGMWQDETSAVKGLDWATGIGWLAGGCAHVFLSCCVDGANDLYKPSAAGISSGNGNSSGGANENVV